MISRPSPTSRYIPEIHPKKRADKITIIADANTILIFLDSEYFFSAIKTMNPLIDTTKPIPVKKKYPGISNMVNPTALNASNFLPRFWFYLVLWRFHNLSHRITKTIYLFNHRFCLFIILEES